jgi:peptide/nickel transport system permease protein
MGLLIRLARAGTVEVMSADYVRFARAQGLSESKVVGLHVLKNIAIPMVTVFGLEFGSTLAFAVVTETRLQLARAWASSSSTRSPCWTAR